MEKSNGNMENTRWKKCRGSLLEKYKEFPTAMQGLGYKEVAAYY